MRLRDFMFLGIGALVLFQLITSFASIRLLSRMSPAIEHILSENVVSNEAAEEMLACLIRDGDVNERRARFQEALTRARDNISETGESALLDKVEGRMAAALEGDRMAATAIADTLRSLSHLNRLSMRRADEAAKRIGNAGAWTMAILGIVGFGAGALVLRRISRNVISPVTEIRNVLNGLLKGEFHRRLFLTRAAVDLRELETLINQILDMLRSTDDIRKKRDQERAALLHLLDRETTPWVLLSSVGEVIAANRLAEDRLLESSDDTPRSNDMRFSEEDGWSSVQLNGGARLVHL